MSVNSSTINVVLDRVVTIFHNFRISAQLYEGCKLIHYLTFHHYNTQLSNPNNNKKVHRAHTLSYETDVSMANISTGLNQYVGSKVEIIKLHAIFDALHFSTNNERGQ